MPDTQQMLTRWRLILGKDAEEHGVTVTGDEAERLEQVLGFVYGLEGSGEVDGISVPRWIDAVSELFPRQAKEVLERELISRKGIDQLLKEPKLLEKVEPNVELLKTLLTHKELLTPKTRGLARRIIDQVVQQLIQQLKITVEPTITGAIRRDRHSPRKVFRNLDLKTTIRRNLTHWDAERQRLMVDRTYFYAAERNKRPWNIIVCVDQSGSMMESTIFSAVMASIFAELPSMRTSLVLYDTRVVDLSHLVGSPVDLLLGAQLGGGNDTPLALQYCQGLIREPRRTIFVLITDFYEGSGEDAMVRQIRQLCDSGVRVVGLGALGYDTGPQINRVAANRCRKVGMDLLVCTPEKLAECMAKIIRGSGRPGG